MVELLLAGLRVAGLDEREPEVQVRRGVLGLELERASVQLDRFLEIIPIRAKDREVEEGWHERRIDLERAPVLGLGEVLLSTRLVDEPEVVPGELVLRLLGDHRFVEVDRLIEATLLVGLERDLERADRRLVLTRAASRQESEHTDDDQRDDPS